MPVSLIYTGQPIFYPIYQLIKLELLKQFIYIWMISLACLPAFAADIVRGSVFDENSVPVIGANVYWEGARNGTTTNTEGYFEIARAEGDVNLSVSYIGYTTLVVPVTNPAEELQLILKGEVALDEVIVSERRMGTIASRTSVLQTQKITYDEICRAACCNLAESFETNPSVDVSYSDAATGARQIKLLGLAGTYVQMLTENYPNFQGAASLYGLDYVPGAWLESIQVSKGTSSVKKRL